ncbi:MAG: sulfatase-like hydrolase/transferase [Planctomycetota bacterium]
MRAAFALLALAACAAPPASPAPPRPAAPNVVLLMADDLGWADVFGPDGGRPSTPALDRMAAEGLRLRRFYAAAPVCSPTRGSVLTGRHPSRYGIPGANSGHLPHDELTLAELLAARGYRTGFFGKWHLGTLTREVHDSNRGGPRGVKHYSPPWEHGFDVAFATEAKVPTWDPMVKPGTDEPYGTRYWVAPEQAETENLAGDDSRVIVDRVEPFLRASAADDAPFLAVIWFHAPHLPLVAGEPYLAQNEAPGRDYKAVVSALDHEVGRVRDLLDELGVADDTLVWFASDNGPETRGAPPHERPHDQPAEHYAEVELGSAAPFRGRKRSLYEGGVRVPSLVAWPAGLPLASVGSALDLPLSTSDILPTVLAAVGEPAPPRTLDGVALLDELRSGATERPAASPGIGFRSGKRAAWSEGRWKLHSSDAGETWELYDLALDPAERSDVATEHAAVAERLAAAWQAWRDDCVADHGR